MRTKRGHVWIYSYIHIHRYQLLFTFLPFSSSLTQPPYLLTIVLFASCPFDWAFIISSTNFVFERVVLLEITSLSSLFASAIDCSATFIPDSSILISFAIFFVSSSFFLSDSLLASRAAAASTAALLADSSFFACQRFSSRSV